MSKNQLVNEVNEKLRNIIGYDPYFVDENGRIKCSCCHTDFTKVADSVETLSKVKKVPDSNGDFQEVHVCSGCKYLQGVNISLKKRISDIRKELDLHEFPSGKFRNKYFKPQDLYKFIIPDDGKAIEVSEQDLYDGLRQFRENLMNGGRANEEATSEKIIDEPEISEEISTEETDIVNEDGSETSDDCDKTNEEAEEIEENVEFNDPPVEDDNTIDDNPIRRDEGEEGNEDELESDTTSEESSEDSNDFFEDEDDLGEIFDHEEIEEEVNENAETSNEENESDESQDNDETETDDIDEFFKNVSNDKEKLKQENSHNDNNSKRTHSGIADVKVERDKTVDSMIKENLEAAEEDIFRTDDRKEHVFNVVRRSRITDLRESYADSNAKIVVDRISTLFEKRANRKLKNKLTINEATHECPVVDFEGNIRLIFVNLDTPGGQYNIESEVNSKLSAPFEDTSEYDLMTFVIYSDMIKQNLMNRVVRAISKNIAYNLKIKGVFNPISVINDSDQYFYTTIDFDKEAISRFDMENCAGNVDKPHNGEVAIVSRWNNPNADEMWKYRKELSNRATLARGGSIEYDDLSMFMTCSMKYIILPQKPDGTINITIVDYIESLDLFVRDGFGALVGVLIHNVKTQYPNSKLHLYYELDREMIPSPTISRYVKNGSIRPVIANPEISKFNNIINVVAKQNSATNVEKIPVEGEPFDSPEYNTNYWRNYILAPEFRKTYSDEKRMDWRRYGRKSFAKTLGEKFKDYKNVNINDRKARQALLEQIGYFTVVQPQVIKAKIIDQFGLKALMKVMQTCNGLFSISQYTKANRSSVVDDSYMANQNNPYMSSFMNPQQMMAQQQQYQQMMMNQFNGFGHGGMQQQ